MWSESVTFDESRRTSSLEVTYLSCENVTFCELENLARLKSRFRDEECDF